MFLNSPKRGRLHRNFPWAFFLTLFEMINSSSRKKGVAQEQQSFTLKPGVLNQFWKGPKSSTRQKVSQVEPSINPPPSKSKCLLSN